MIAAKYLEHRTVDCDAVGYLDRAEALPPGPDGAARVRLTGWCFCAGCGAPHALRFRPFGAAAAETMTLTPVRRDDVVACYDGCAQLAWCGFDQEVSVPAAALLLTEGEHALGAVELADGAAPPEDGEAFWATVFEPHVHFAAHHLPPPLHEEAEPAPLLQLADNDEEEPEEKGGPVAMIKMHCWGDNPVVCEKIRLTGNEKQREGTYFDNNPFAPRVATRAPATVVVVDGVYEDPLAVRAFALAQEFRPHPVYHRGERTDEVFLFPGLRELVERRLGVRIRPERWAAHPSNGCFQWCRAGDPVVLHTDHQRFAGVLFLTPDAPVQCGTSLYRPRGEHWDHMDATKVEVVDQIGNLFNRLVIFDAQSIHSASQYFGCDKHSGRLFQMFFFDTNDEDAATEEH